MEKLLHSIDMIALYKIIILFIAFNVGIKFPDWDFQLNLKHRSIITHSPIILLIFLQFYQIDKSEFLRVFISGFSMAMAIHFIFDIFPKGWSRGALLHIPILKIELSPNISKLSFFIFIIISMFICLNTTKEFEEYILLGIFSGIKIIRDIKREGKIVRPLLLFLIFFCLLGSVKYKEFEKKMIKSSSNLVKEIDKISKKII
ncbi:hypothetical protein [Fusobacterium perfoetens]|uniref:hypothetical protein n=1 Tax=Fusobacterium perfoetens TaxID=852 RepID=UPI00047F2DEA|nr:hypothetical protein [Fusobacterium perfoetens]MCI6153168.1 hypothetical protein [Fusobacterium perfoetens]MDY3237098.1 hypothetical protein [Fusobacterium perfoetens]